MGVAITAGLIIGLIGLAIAYLVYFITAAICKRIDRKTIDNSKWHKFKVVSPDAGLFPTYVYMDGIKLKGIRSVDYHISLDELPTITLELYAREIEMNGIYKKITGGEDDKLLPRSF